MFPRVSYGSRRKHENGRRAVKLRNAQESTDHVSQMRAKHAPVAVKLVDDHETKIRYEPGPSRVVGQDSGVQHVRIRDENTCPISGCPPRIRRSISIVRDRTLPETRGREK